MSQLAAAWLVLLASGVAAFAVAHRPRLSGAIGSAGAPLAALLCALPVARVLAGGASLRAELPWSLPGGSISLELDALSAFFLVPVLALSALAALYGRAYLSDHADPRRVAASWLFFNGLCAAMMTVTLARNGILFLVAWETMSLCAYVLVSFEHERAEVRRAGWVYLVASHAGTAALLALFVLLGDAFDAHSGAAPAAATSTLLALAFVGFGVKAGIVPLHVWLPEAHAAAPSHVSALMSGAMVKLGYYGLLRVGLVVGGVAPGFGAVLAGFGLAGALLGISLALSQRDMKRALAHSSVENLGLIGLGLGIGLEGMARGDDVLAGFGLAAGLFHVWNHAWMKGLLFFAAGAIQHASGTRDLERLGGLARVMPRAALLFAVGALALAALPPLSGFASEWLLYQGLLHAVTAPGGLSSLSASLGLGLLAFVGALGAAAFVRLFGIAFLGQPRSEEAGHAHDLRGAMLGVMAALALACLVIGASPGLLLAAVAAPLRALLGAQRAELAFAPVSASLKPVAALALALVLTTGVSLAVLALGFRRAGRAANETWACGYAAVSARMQYTALSLSELLTSRVLPRALAPSADAPELHGFFPAPSEMRTRHDEPLIARVYQPLFSALAGRFTRLRLLQQGNSHLYVAYILVAVVAALAWASLRGGSQP